MFYEMGIHLIKYGRMPEYVDRYDKQTGQLGACRRSEIELFGVWTDDIGVGNKFRYIVKWESMAQREEGWAKFRVDKLWTEGRAATEKDDGPWTEDSWNSFLLLTPYSPEPKVTSKVQELLVYEAIQGKVGLLNDLLANHAMGYFKKHGIDPDRCLVTRCGQQRPAHMHAGLRQPGGQGEDLGGLEVGLGLAEGPRHDGRGRALHPDGLLDDSATPSLHVRAVRR